MTKLEIKKMPKKPYNLLKLVDTLPESGHEGIGYVTADGCLYIYKDDAYHIQGEDGEWQELRQLLVNGQEYERSMAS